MERKTGARALRSIVEGILLDVMYELPTKENIDKCLITRDVVTYNEKPIYIESDRKTA
jgi:ATP-dependent Clp protease ATP-binding subunit ClpX